MTAYKIVLFGVKETTKIIATYMHQQGIDIDLMISIDQTLAKKNLIADYADLRMTAQKVGAQYYCAKDYGLQRDVQDFFQYHSFEIGIVYGWQRLIPSEVIASFKQGIFGFHASPQRLPKGRGRSPLNWGLILGKTHMYNHCFRYVDKADAGDIFSAIRFAINPQDTILTLIYKSLLISKKEIIRLVQDIEMGSLKLTPQRGCPYFFNKRTAEDGLINFATDSTRDIVNLIRGVTKPFPGAFCYTTQGKKIIIWEAWSFDHLLDFSQYQPGAVIDNIYNMPVVKTTDGSIILKQYEGEMLRPDTQLVNYLSVL
jgi:methionyl-tRNA formyltransferase